MDKSRLVILKALFASHPTVDAFHLTSDDQAFAVEHFADAHAQTLEDKKAIKFERKTIETLEKVVDILTESKEAKAKEVKAPAVVKAVKTDDGKAELQAEYLQLFGKKASHLTGAPKLKEAIDAKKAELAEAAKGTEGEETGNA